MSRIRRGSNGTRNQRDRTENTCASPLSKKGAIASTGGRAASCAIESTAGVHILIDRGTPRGPDVERAAKDERKAKDRC